MKYYKENHLELLERKTDETIREEDKKKTNKLNRINRTWED